MRSATSNKEGMNRQILKWHKSFKEVEKAVNRTKGKSWNAAGKGHCSVLFRQSGFIKRARAAYKEFLGEMERGDIVDRRQCTLMEIIFSEFLPKYNTDSTQGTDTFLFL